MLGDWISYATIDNQLTIKYAIGITQDKHPTPSYIGEISANINYYKDGTFTISNLEFEAYQDNN